MKGLIYLFIGACLLSISARGADSSLALTDELGKSYQNEPEIRFSNVRCHMEPERLSVSAESGQESLDVSLLTGVFYPKEVVRTEATFSLDKNSKSSVRFRDRYSIAWELVADHTSDKYRSSHCSISADYTAQSHSLSLKGQCKYMKEPEGMPSYVHFKFDLDSVACTIQKPVQ